MMTPKDPNAQPSQSSDSHSQPDATVPRSPRAKKSAAKDMAANPQVAAKTPVKPQSPKTSKKVLSLVDTAVLPAAIAPTPTPAPAVEVTATAPAAMRVGDYAHERVQHYFERMFRERDDVLDDRSPEALHQMRVQGRRLRTTIALFGAALKIPKQGQLKQLRQFHRTLGERRNLDVVIAQLQQDYYPHLPEAEQHALDRCCKKLAKRQKRALADVQGAIAAQTFESVYAAWLKQPEYRNFAAQPVTHVLPQLLLPDLAAFLAHPGWAIAAADATTPSAAVLHDLRKACKHQRYQLDTVSQIYGATIAAWIVDLKAIQDCLGRLQDLAVLQETVLDEIELPHLTALLQQQRQIALAQWEELRQPYLQPQFHHQCYTSILQVLTV
jgi:CHAD domain-containing protein